MKTYIDKTWDTESYRKLFETNPRAARASVARHNLYVARIPDHIPPTYKIEVKTSSIPPLAISPYKPPILLPGTTLDAINIVYSKMPWIIPEVLNFADARQPGGLYLSGAQTQEEELCRACPELFESLKVTRYPFDFNHSFLYTPGVRVIRNPNNLWATFREENMTINIITAAAPNISIGDRFNWDNVENLIENIFTVPLKSKAPKIIILGAWGCGAFKNNPYVIAGILKDAYRKFGGYYNNVIFAIPPGINYDVFKTVLSSE